MTTLDFLSFIIYLIFFVLVIFWFSYLQRRVKETWLSFVRADFFSKQKYALLEISIPRGQTKSPLAMELFLNCLYQPFGEGIWKDFWFKGTTKPWFSLELVSMEGKVRFFIWTREGYVTLIKTQLYAQFPSIDIKELYQGDYKNDYIHGFEYDLEKYKFTCFEFRKKGADHLPIKTYVDYGLDKDPKEEFKIDPITTVLEYLGSLGKGEYTWIQMGIRAPGKDRVKEVPSDNAKAAEFRKANKMKWYQRKVMVDWTYDAKDDIKKMTKRDAKETSMAEMRLTKTEEEKLNAVERGLTKVAFDANIRAIYFANKDVFSPANSAGLMGVMRQYNTLHLNSFELKMPLVKRAWMDKKGLKINSDKKSIFDQYKYRSFFYSGCAPEDGVIMWKSNKYITGKPFILNTEELATMFHFPGDTATATNISRVEAKKVEPPANLPI